MGTTSRHARPSAGTLLRPRRATLQRKACITDNHLIYLFETACPTCDDIRRARSTLQLHVHPVLPMHACTTTLQISALHRSWRLGPSVNWHSCAACAATGVS